MAFRGPEAHRDRRVLPEVRHAPGVRVARQTARRDLLAEPVELLLGEPALDECSRVDPGRGVSLEVDLVAGPAVGLSPEEVVEPDLVQRGRARVRGEVAADALAAMIGARHHDGGVPPDHRSDPPLHVLVAGEPGLRVAGNRVDVRGRHGGGESHLLRPGALDELHQQEPCPWAVRESEIDRVERVEPLGSLGGIDVWQLVGHAVEQHDIHAPTARKVWWYHSDGWTLRRDRLSRHAVPGAEAVASHGML